MKKILISYLCILMLCGGCASAGKFKLVEWDSRSAEQIQAMETADMAVYNAGCGVYSTPTMEAKAIPIDLWTGLMAMISGLRVRIGICVCEWGPSPKPQ